MTDRILQSNTVIKEFLPLIYPDTAPFELPASLAGGLISIINTKQADSIAIKCVDNKREEITEEIWTYGEICHLVDLFAYRLHQL